MHYREVLKVVGGSVAVYLIVVACGAGDSSSGTAGALDGKGLEGSGSDVTARRGGGSRGTAESAASVASGRAFASPGEGVSDSAAEVLQAILDPVPDALAQEECSCTVTEPIEVAGPVAIEQPVKTVTADSDPEQALQARRRLTGGYVYKLADGPLFVNQAQGSEVYTGNSLRAGNIELHVVPGTECTEASLQTRTFEYYVGFDNGPALYNGVHFLVPAGSSLCASVANSAQTAVLRWSGFRPYGT